MLNHIQVLLLQVIVWLDIIYPPMLVQLWMQLTLPIVCEDLTQQLQDMFAQLVNQDLLIKLQLELLQPHILVKPLQLPTVLFLTA